MSVPIPPPPLPIHQRRLGTRLHVGLGIATVNAECDFETYSEAGYLWDVEARKWRVPLGAKLKGLPTIGLDNYARHPTTRILMLAYDLKDGLGWRHWNPSLPAPADLFAHLARGGLLEAHNAMFERRMWEHVAHARLGWPAVHPRQWRCSAAKARSYALPGSLAPLGEVLRLPVQKDGRGVSLMKTFSMPRDPTATDARLSIPLQYDRPLPPVPQPGWKAVDGRRAIRAYEAALKEHEDSLAYAQYNVTDIVTEAEASGRMPDLEGEELEWWFADQAINARGVHVDRQGLEDCAAIVRQCIAKYEAELRLISGIDSANAGAQIIAFLATQGVHTESVDEENVDLMLARTDLTPLARRVLEIRQAIGSASVKKVFAMLNRISPDDRMRDLYIFCGAHTGRATSEGPQAANLPSAGPSGYTCASCATYFAGTPVCPTCETLAAPGAKSDWSPKAAEQALAVIATRDVTTVERHYGSALHAVAGCLRGLYVAAPGHELISSDYNSIEAVGLAMLSGEKWRIDTFNTHGKIYEASAGAAFGVPFAEMMRTRGYTDEQLAHPQWWTLKPANPGNHHPLRKKGKVLELACLAPDTRVVTHRGIVRLIDITEEHLLWDGRNWVVHRGLVSRGVRPVIDLGGTRMTPDHLVLCGTSWKAASLLDSDGSIRSQALATGLENLPTSVMRAKTTSECSALVGRLLISSPTQTSEKAARHGVTFAQKLQPVLTGNGISSTPLSSLMTSTVDACSIVSPQRSEGVIARAIRDTRTMAVEAFTSSPCGEKRKANFFGTWRHFLGGTTRTLTWIEPTSIKATSPEISGLSPEKKIKTTDEKSKFCKPESMSLSDVYDIAHAGPLNRFTIATDDGYLIVHNCGYGGWVGSAHAFDMPGTEEEIIESILKWRAASPNVVWFWGGQTRGKANSILGSDDKWDKTPFYFGVEGATFQALQDKGREYPVIRMDGSASGVSFIYVGDTLFCKLPSPDHTIKYHRPIIGAGRRPGELAMSFEGWNTNPKNGPKGWIRKETYGARQTENINQALCRDVLRPAVIRLEARGYPVVMHTYDEIVSEIPIGFGSHEEFEALVEERPAWARDWPIRAPDSWRGRRYRKA